MKTEPFLMLKGLIKSPQKVVIDTIPLLLFLIGGYDEKLISEFKRLKSYHYSVKDFKTLQNFLSHSRNIIVTPGVLCEVSNYAEQLANDRFSELINTNIKFLKYTNEIYIKKDTILESNQIFKFGFTDTSILFAAKKNNGGILTKDYKLYNYCKNFGVHAYFLDTILEIGRGHKG